MARIDSFLRLVVEQRASDLHFHAGAKPIIRHHGELVSLPFRALTAAEARRFLFEILSPEERERFEAEQELDLLYALPGVGRFRANIFVQSHGFGAAFRIIPDRPPGLEELGFPPVVKRLTELRAGLVLIGGPTGSGKTTTLAAIVNEINRSMAKHILTIEDPVEFLHDPIRSAITQRQVGAHVDTFADALRSSLRETPDVLVVGEMRDPETVSLALQASETGVLVFGTLHTNSASKTLTRILDMTPEESREQMRLNLSSHLRGVIAQQLVRRAGGDGRVAAVEILLGTPNVGAMIREDKLAQLEGFLQTANPIETGMQSLDACLTRYVRDGLIDVEDAVRVAAYPDRVRRAATAMEGDAG